MRLLKMAAVTAALMLGLAFAPVAAFAQDVVQAVSVDPEVTVLQQILVVGLPALFGVLSIVSILIYAEIKRRFGIEIEAQHRQALQSALENGIKWGLQQIGWLPQDAGKPTPALLDAAASYVISSVPDALKQFKIDPKTPTGKAKLERLLTPHLPIPGPGDTLIGRVSK